MHLSSPSWSAVPSMLPYEAVSPAEGHQRPFGGTCRGHLGVAAWYQRDSRSFKIRKTLNTNPSSWANFGKIFNFSESGSQFIKLFSPQDSRSRSSFPGEWTLVRGLAALGSGQCLIPWEAQSWRWAPPTNCFSKGTHYESVIADLLLEYLGGVMLI